MKYSFPFTLLFIVFLAFSSSGQNDKMLEILTDEMASAKEAFSTLELPPYYFDASVAEVFEANVTLESGILSRSDTNRAIVLQAGLRIGDHNFDNTHTMSDEYWGAYPDMVPYAMIPKDKSELSIKYNVYQLWNDLYENNLDQYKQNKEQIGLTTKEIKPSKDLTVELAEQYYEPPLPPSTFDINLDAWAEKLIAYHKILKPHAEEFALSISFNFMVTRSYFVSSEGAEIAENRQLANISIFGINTAEDKGIIPVQYSAYAFTPEGLPTEEVILAELESIAQRVEALKVSDKAEPYVGPAILSPEAAAVFFHEIFGHRIEGHRLAQFLDSKTFAEKIGDYILPKFLSVTFDPTQTTFENEDLVGHYVFDNQGIRGQRVECIKDGILNDYLMSRKPVEGFEKSNGHGRCEFLSAAVSRQSNMFVEASKTYSDEELRKKLIKECKKQDLEYGYYFKTVSGGFTNTMTYMPDFFSIIPLEVYKIYVDGKPDELVRGVNMIGTPLVMFSEIIAAGDEQGLFNGICGAESGGVPVAAIAPSLLVKKIETQNQMAIEIDKPILPSPEVK